ncbi:nucleolin 2-like isoform X2 [Gossypium australe]|uniref:Nucleolin 2-like isoform X2 n=1 Tax=Gossypium australe TaxID=47621 RepID=A0A5B6WR85_9ROSI|nr:nucleolin 2-like isoform X2 [Gossypium australe]
MGNQPPNVEQGNVRERDDSQLRRAIADALQGVAGTASATTSTPTVRRAPIKELRVDPSTAEIWIEATKKILQQLECTPRESLLCVVSLLQGEAYVWWESVTCHVSTEQKEYVGELYIDDKK